MPDTFADVLRERTAGLIALSDAQVAALAGHYSLLERWNRVLNLTSVREWDEAVERHYCESLFLVSLLPVGQLTVMDLGSGAGFPGFPVGVARQDCSVALVESHQRKAVFLREASRGIGNIRVVSARAEGISDSFDWVVSRAVNLAGMSVLLGRLGENVALLGGDEPPVEEFNWRGKVRVPWGKQRYVWLGAKQRST